MSRITDTVSIERALRILADRRRRFVLGRLIDSERNAVTLDALVEHASLENPRPEPVGVCDADRFLFELHHVHLPKLEDAGLVEYVERTETIHYTPSERVEKLHRFVTAELE